jgi:tetratricopeptide (TPR) repeat protein
MLETLLLVFLMSGGEKTTPARPVDVQAFSLLGKPLFPPPMPEDVRVTRERERREAYQRWERHPEDVETWIWLGRRTAYLGLYKDAIDLYTRAIERFPDDPRLYRHRGHRYVTVREFDRAIADLERAVELIEGTEDVVEPDGLPNARNQPTSTLQGNVWYHLGLAHYLEGDFDRARHCYRMGLKLAANPDTLCATSYWLYMTLRRLGREDAARAVLEPIEATMDVIENHAYHQLLMMYKGLRTEQQVRESAGGAIDRITIGYGIGNRLFWQGEREQALRIFRDLLEEKQWPAFGYIAAEAEVARAGGAKSERPSK